MDALLDGFIHDRPATFSQEWKEQLKQFMWPAGLLALVPSFLFWGAYDYRADGIIGIEYIIYLMTIVGTAAGLMTSYTQTYVDYVYSLKMSSQDKLSEKSG